MTSRRALALLVALAAPSCRHAAREPSVAPPPASERVIPLPAGEPSEGGPAVLAHLMRGLEFLASGHPGAAVTELRLALVYDPTSAFIHERLAMAWAATGDVERARAVLDDGLKRAPAAPGLNLIAGELADTERRWTEAAGYLEKAVADDALLGRAGPYLVDVLAWRGPVARAEARARELAARAPADPGLAFGLAGALEDHGSLGAALELYRAARSQRPADEGATFGEVRVLVLQGHEGEAADAIVPLFRYYPDEVELVVEVARLLRRAHRPEAAAYRKEALRLTEGDPEGRLRLAAADLAEGDRELGLALLRQAVQTWPEYGEARAFLAEASMIGGDAAACVEVLAPVVRGASPLHRLRGECLAMTGAFDLAVDELEGAARSGTPRDELAAASGILARWAPDEKTATALRIELVERLGTVATPEDAIVAEAVMLDYYGHREALDLVRRLHEGAIDDMDALMRWTDLASRYGEVDAAVEALDRLVRKDAQSPVLLNALGFTLAEAGRRLDEAEVWLRRAHRLVSDQGFIMDSLGWVLFRRGDLDDAERLLERADAVSPGDPEILRHLGDVLERLGRGADARRCWERALARRPSIPVRALLERRLAGSLT